MKQKTRDKSIERETVVYTGANGVKINALADANTIWLNRQQLAVLFGRDVKTIGKHIANALKEELEGFPVVAKFATTAADGKTYQVEHYSIDMILSVGYRVKSSDAEKLIKYVVNTLMPPVAKREPIGFRS